MTSLKKCINKIDHREHKIKMETENYPQEEISEFCLRQSQKFEFRGPCDRLSRFREGKEWLIVLLLTVMSQVRLF